MSKIKNLFFILLGLTLVFAGCKKTTDDGGDNPPASKKCLITKMDYGSTYDNVTYTSDNLISTMVEYDSTGAATGSVTNFSYNGTKLSNMTSLDNGNINFKVEYKYSGGDTPDSAIIWTNNGSGVLEIQGAYALTFSGSNLVKSELIVSYMGQSIAVSKTEYSYTNSNLTEVKDYQFGSSGTLELNDTKTYQYDTKNNSLNGIGLNFLFIAEDVPVMSKNNILKSIYKDDSGTVDPSMSYTNTIEYNSDNYPTKITTTYDDGSIDVVNYTYDCK